MKRFFTLIAILVFAFTTNLSAQEVGISKKEQKAAKRMLEAQKDSIAGVMAKNAIDSGEWIFNAISINVSGGAMMNVPSNLNFLMVQGEQFTFQTSTGFGGGPNNMGGITTTGLIKIEAVDVDRHCDNKQNIYLINKSNNNLIFRLSLLEGVEMRNNNFCL